MGYWKDLKAECSQEWQGFDAIEKLLIGGFVVPLSIAVAILLLMLFIMIPLSIFT